MQNNRQDTYLIVTIFLAVLPRQTGTLFDYDLAADNDDEDTDSESDNFSAASDEEESLPQNKFRYSVTAYILIAMVSMLYIGGTPHVTIEKVFMFLNIILRIQDDEYRFPKTVTTFLKRHRFVDYFLQGVCFYNVCS